MVALSTVLRRRLLLSLVKKQVKSTLVEAAYLAALPQAPTYYSPYGKHRDELEKRKNLSS
jgi:membrane carboxypeptidase/penicillin-binding protein